MESGNVAKTVILSSFLTFVVVVGTLFVAREQITAYLLAGAPQAKPAAHLPAPAPPTSPAVPVIEKVNDAVVSVVVTKDVPVYERYYETYEPWGWFGSGFSVPRMRENGTEEREVGGGSGFIVSNDGMIVTNRHVVDDDDARYSVLLNDGTTYSVEVLARDPQLDIAVLKISDPIEESLSYVTFGDSESLKLGEIVIAIGNALAEFRNSVSVGVVSGLSRTIIASDGFGMSEQLDGVIQTDAAINPGNSGGPLLNLDGEVIGVNVATSRGADNIGFALPAHLVAQVVASVREHGEILRPFLGVRYTMIDQAHATAYNLPVDYGALIIAGESPDDVAIVADSPAEIAGLREGMIILAIDGVLLRDRDLATMLRSKQVGEAIELLVRDGDSEKTITVTLDQAL